MKHLIINHGAKVRKAIALTVAVTMLSALAVTFVPATTASAATTTSATTAAGKVISIAKSKLGTRYVFGSNGPNTFDCSSFVRYVFRKVGISLPRTALAQSRVGDYVSKANLKKGDLVFFTNTYKPGVSHVGIYIGSGKFIHAWPRSGVKISSLSERYFTVKWWGAKRVIGS